VVARLTSSAKGRVVTIFISVPPLTAHGSDGSRLSKLYAEDPDHAGIVAKLDPLFAAYAAGRKPGERFGGFVIRAGFVAPTTNGADFHAKTGPQRKL
jgi:sulfite reductase beta subunit-like hemoprotein